MTDQTLRFYFDFISHNAYLAWHALPALAKKHGLTIEPVPVLFAGFLNHYGQKGPAEMPDKSRWMIWNVLRKAQQHGIPIAPPASHPFNPLLPLRACCVPMAAGQRLALVDRLYRATWAQGRAVQEPAVVAECARACGLDADALLAAAQSEPVKAQLKANIDAALAAGAFGVPTMIVRGELFWGFDDLPYLDSFLAGQDPLGERGRHQAWLAIRPSAQRKAVSKPS